MPPLPAAHTQGKNILMRAASLTIPDIILLEPKAIGDDQGFFILTEISH
jgi:dTDP-4-dehydrorhamnose 3,5-epimerase-like enzyme